MTDKNENFVVYFCSFLANFCVPVRAKFLSQKLALAKILNKHPFLKVEVVGAYLRVAAHLRGAHSIIFPIGWALIQVECLFKRGAYLRIYSKDHHGG